MELELQRNEKTKDKKSIAMRFKNIKNTSISSLNPVKRRIINVE